MNEKYSFASLHSKENHHVPFINLWSNNKKDISANTISKQINLHSKIKINSSSIHNNPYSPSKKWSIITNKILSPKHSNPWKIMSMENYPSPSPNKPTNNSHNVPSN